jgi:hypothetical protein
MASKPKKPSNKKSNIEVLRLSFPTEADWKSLITRFRLSDDQAHNLSVVLQQVIADLDQFRAVTEAMPKRSQLVSRIKRLEKVFGNIASELKRAEKDLPHLLPNDVGSFIGLAMNFTAIGEALGKEEFPVFVDFEIERGIRDNRLLTQKQIEEVGKPKRESLGLNHSHILLPYLINGIYEPLRLWVELNRKNKGGRTPNMLRRYLAYWLIYEAKDILGRKPIIAQNGKFVEFCEAVFEACRLSYDGLDKILPALVKRVREDKKRHAANISTPNFKLRILVEKPQ